MDVGNSTEQPADYKVGNKPGGMRIAPAKPCTGRIEPGETHPVEEAHGDNRVAEFRIGGKVVASAEINAKTSRVELVRNGDGFQVKVS